MEHWALFPDIPYVLKSVGLSLMEAIGGVRRPHQSQHVSLTGAHPLLCVSIAHIRYWQLTSPGMVTKNAGLPKMTYI